MTEKDIAVAIARRVIRFQVREIASDTLLSRMRLNGQELDWQDQLERDMEHDLSPESPSGRWLAQIERALEVSSPDEVLDVLYRELFDTSYPHKE